MALLNLDGVVNVWSRCSCCGHLVRPAIIARRHGEPRNEFYCFRCYHILAAVRILNPALKGVA